MDTRAQSFLVRETPLPGNVEQRNLRIEKPPEYKPVDRYGGETGGQRGNVSAGGRPAVITAESFAGTVKSGWGSGWHPM